MNELDRRVAIEVMGEEEPPLPPNAEELAPGSSAYRLHFSEGGNWAIGYEFFHAPGSIGNKVVWKPLAFSTSLEHAMRAVDKYFDGMYRSTSLRIEYYPTIAEFSAHIVDTSGYGYGQTLPEAICNLLLVLKEREVK